MKANVYGARNVGIFPVFYEEDTVENPWKGQNNGIQMDFEHFYLKYFRSKKELPGRNIISRRGREEQMRRERNDLVVFLVGVIMLAAGLYWFASSVRVVSGFYSWRLMGMNTGGLILVPFIVGICWLFYNPKSMVAKLIIVLGIVVVLASIIAGTQFIFRDRNLYEYVIMLVFIFGGAAFTAKVLLAKPKDAEEINRDLEAKAADYDRIKDELDDLKKKMR